MTSLFIRLRVVRHINMASVPSIMMRVCNLVTESPDNVDERIKDSMFFHKTSKTLV